KIHSQPAYFVRMPPKSTPAAAPLPPIAPQIPTALFRSDPSSNVVMMIASVAGDTIAAPIPCTVRAPIRKPIEVARPQKSDAIENSAIPIMNIRRRPSRSAARPPSSRRPPNVIVYAMSTHCSVFSDTFSDVLIDGSATLTIETSRTVMNIATQTSASACQRCGSGPAVVCTDSSPLLRIVSRFSLERQLLVCGRTQYLFDIRRNRAVHSHVLAGLFREEPAVLEQLVQELGCGSPAPEVGGNGGDRRLEDLGEPASRRGRVRHRFVTGPFQ